MKTSLLPGLILGLLAPLLRAEPAPAVPPPFREYIGSTFNGDFEAGSASTGNQYWGQYVPARSSVAGEPAMMTLVTDPAGTAPGSVRNGKNMVSISRGGLAWNFATLSVDAADRLPRAGDLVGGSYWLYVPADADLGLGVPAVYFICQNAGVDTIIADTATFPTASLVKGQWNRVPVYPKAGATLSPTAGKVAVMITAPSFEASSNPVYSSKYYIDEIRLGAIPRGVFFGSATGLAEANGRALDTLGVDDSAVQAGVVLQNTSADSPVSGHLVLKLYEREILKLSRAKPLVVAGRGSLGVSNTFASIEAPLAGLDKNLLNARLYFYADAAQTVELAAPFSLVQQTRPVSPTDPAIRYFGRWSPDGAGYRGNWIRPYFKVNFNGSFSLKIHLLRPTSLSVLLDGVRTDYSSVSGLVNLGSNLSISDTHTLRVAGLGWRDALLFDALVLDDVGVLRAPVVGRDHIEFIGDSITAWDNGYSWLVPERLGVEASRIAWPGIALVDGFGYYALPAGGGAREGIQSAYFQNGMPGFGTAGSWNFATSPYAPNLIVINIGTNDSAQITGNTARLDGFEKAYRSLIQQVRVRFPVAEIFVLRPFSITQADVQTAILGATQAVIGGGDARVHFLDTSSWDVAIATDGVHPTNAGHVTIADKLAPILAPYLTGGVKPQGPATTGASEEKTPASPAAR